MKPDQIPVLKVEVPMSLVSEPQPEADSTSAKLYEDARQSVVKIVSDKENSGSGFLVNDGSEVVTTARNIIGSKEQFAIGTDGKRHKLELEKLNDVADLAVLKIIDGKIPGSKPLTLGGSDSLNPGDAVWGLSFPRNSHSESPYISPGYARQLSSPLRLISIVDESAIEGLKQKIPALGPQEQIEAESYLTQPLIESRMHMEKGAAGSPVLGEDGKVIGIAALSNGVSPTAGETLVIPVERAKQLMSDSGSFAFKYKSTAADWAEQYKADWKSDNTLAAVETGAAAVLGGIAYKAASRFPLPAALAAGGFGLSKLSTDANLYMESRDSSDRLKHGLASLADLSTTTGAALMLTAKFKTVGLAMAGIGIAGRAASDFIRNRHIVSEITRIDPQDDAKRPPFSFEELMKP